MANVQWIAAPLSTTPGLRRSPRCRIKDYYLLEDENEEPRLDAVQNVEDAVVTRADGWTVGEFRRRLDTGDNSGITRDRIITQVCASPCHPVL